MHHPQTCTKNMCNIIYIYINIICVYIYLHAVVKAVDDSYHSTGARLDRTGCGRLGHHIAGVHHGRFAAERLGAPALIAGRRVPHAVFLAVAGRLMSSNACVKERTRIVSMLKTRYLHT